MHRLGRACLVREGDGAASVAAEFQPLGAHLQPPVLAELHDRHRAGLPVPLTQATLQRDGLWWRKRGGHGGDEWCHLHRDQSLGWVEAGLPRFNNPRGAQVPLFSARVLVSLRPSVLDPAGEATRAAAARLGVDGVSRLRIGKAVEVELEAADADAARQQLELLSDRLLANPVIENWTLELKDGASAGA